MNNLEKRIIDISKKYKLSHLSSNLSAVNIIDEIFSIKRVNDKFILSSGHAGLALYVVLEKYHGLNAEKLHEKYGVHPERCLEDHLFCSSGSLGCGLPIAVGMAMADKNQDIYCLISDGEIFEGSIYESCNFITKYSIENIKIFLNVNGFSALEKLDINKVIQMAKNLHQDINVRKTDHIYEKFSFLNGLSGHYNTIN